ncbi:MAG: hypothetical protein Q8M99_05730 [Methylotenera sp.]|nr:hypothetical protein [Methylotenera sp.]
MKSVYIITGIFLMFCQHSDAADNNTLLEQFKIGGFSSAAITLPRDAEAEAAINELSLLISWNNLDRLSFFSELEIERPLAWNDSERYSRKESKFDLERLYFDYNLSEKLNFRIGRFLTPNSRWNLLRAPPLVWTNSRPLATTRLFPMATNGITLHGAFLLNDVAFEYKFFTELLEDQEQDNNELKFEHVKGTRFSFKSNSEVGISLLSFRERDSLNAFSDTSYRMLGLDFITRLNETEVSGEIFQRITSKGKDGGSGAYIQTAVPIKANWYWITRLETLNRPYEGSFERWLVGATLRVKPTQLLKFEFTGGSGGQPEALKGFNASYAILF